MAIKEKIEKLERARFLLAMKDSWLRADFDEDVRLAKEIEELKKML